MKKFLFSGDNRFTIVLDDDTIAHGKTTKLVADKILHFFRDLSDEAICELLELNDLLKNMKNEKEIKSLVEEDDRFEGEGLNVRLKGFPVNIPESILELVKTEEKILNMWKWTCLIPNPQTIEYFVNYFLQNELYVTKEGLILMFRKSYRVDTVHLEEVYQSLKKNKKKTNIPVFYENGKLELSGTHQIGMLPEVINGVFRSKHYNPEIGLPNFYIKGIPYVETKLDWDNSQTCSSGIHCAGLAYDFSGYGDVVNTVLVNPADIVACPEDYSSKMRVKRITFLDCYESKKDARNDIENQLKIASELFENEKKRLEEEVVLPESMELFKREVPVYENMFKQIMTPYKKRHV